MIPIKPQTNKPKIRPPRKFGTSNKVDPIESWEILSNAINDIENKNASKWSFEQLYRIAYNLVLSKNGEFLYNKIKDEFSKHLNTKLQINIIDFIIERGDNNVNNNGIIELNKVDSLEVLKKLNLLWSDYLISTWLISQVAMYMDRTFTKEHRLPLIYDVGLNIFQDKLINCKITENSELLLGTQILETFLNYFDLNRNGEMIDKFIIKSIIKIFESLINLDGDSYYNKYFEPELIIHSHRYYYQIVEDLLQLQSGSVFINKIVEIIKEEESRFSLYLPESSSRKLKNLMFNDLISSNLKNILILQDDGLKNWIDSDNFELLEKVYILQSKIDTNKRILKDCLHSLVLENGEHLKRLSKAQLNNDSAAKKKSSNKENNTQFAINYIKNFLDYKSKYDKIITKSFDSDIEMNREIEFAFVKFLNENNRIQEYLSLYIDECLKKTLKNKPTDEVEKTLNDCILIFKFIKDKDIFEKYYKTHLARRLLNNRSISTELELMMIHKLKAETGATFTSKFENMFKDMKVSQDLSQKFKNESIDNSTLAKDLARLNNNKKLEIDFTILTGDVWPMSNNKAMDDVNYVPVLDIAKASFEKFYASTYNGRNLVWAPNMCTMNLQMNFPSKSYLINMPTLAAFVILTCFNDEDTEDGEKPLSFEEIQQMTRIPASELTRHLQSISVVPTTRILKKVPMSRSINSGDMFSLNLEFKHPQTKFKIAAISTSSSSNKAPDTNSNNNIDATVANSKIESEEEHEKTLQSIQKSRDHEIDAAIVRIMKARKSVKYQILVSEVIRLIEDVSKRFRPQPSQIKMRLEDLVDKEYIRRDDDDHEVFVYVA
ncbi:cullin [Pichia kluyveri]|uniref:Cullin n=1 Tax=Pichia kluyveri TaxID=36015 RepID=A0AAV5R0E2_PICKL|nr:cullin [Pichia kluyveri]